MRTPEHHEAVDLVNKIIGAEPAFQNGDAWFTVGAMAQLVAGELRAPGNGGFFYECINNALQKMAAETSLESSLVVTHAKDGVDRASRMYRRPDALTRLALVVDAS
jgi:hypothetical protein